MTTPNPLLHEKSTPNHTHTIGIGRTHFGNNTAAVIAGPCAVESLEQLQRTAQALKKLGVNCLRAGAFKPRTSPYNFQGLGLKGLELLQVVREEFELAVVSEVMSIHQLEMAAPYLDCFQVGARNMQNFELLKALGKTNKPVLLKRGLAATVTEFLLSSEYILSEGNPNVILCERGIRSFDTSTRNVLDLGAVALLKEKTHLPVIVDPSHATGKRSLVGPMARAAIAAGANGVIIEAHPEPEKSVSDAAQAISLEELARLVSQLQTLKTTLTSMDRNDSGKGFSQ